MIRLKNAFVPAIEKKTTKTNREVNRTGCHKNYIEETSVVTCHKIITLNI